MPRSEAIALPAVPGGFFVAHVFSVHERRKETRLPFVKGQPGGPGRPKIGEDLKHWARGVFNEHGRAALEQEINKHGPRWFQSVELVMAYAFGKPTQPLAGDPDSSPVRIRVEYTDASPAPADAEPVADYERGGPF